MELGFVAAVIGLLAVVVAVSILTMGSTTLFYNMANAAFEKRDQDARRGGVQKYTNRASDHLRAWSSWFGFFTLALYLIVVFLWSAVLVPGPWGAQMTLSEAGAVEIILPDKSVLSSVFGRGDGLQGMLLGSALYYCAYLVASALIASILNRQMKS